MKRTIYVPKSKIDKKLLISGYHALSEYSLLNPSAVCCLAADSVAAWENLSSRKLQSPEEQYAVELWRYDPQKLSEGVCVDRISLALALREERDERVEEAVDEMLMQVWRDIDGKRN